MKKVFTNAKQNALRIATTALAVFLAGTFSAFAASTISTNVQTDGTLSVTGTSNQTGVATFGNNILIAPAGALDTSAAGALYIGTSSATSITVGKAGVTTTVVGPLSATTGLAVSGGATTLAGGGLTISGTGNNFLIAPASSIDTSSAGALYIGTSTATSIAIGKSGVTTTIGGPLTLSGAFSPTGGLAVSGGASTFTGGNVTINGVGNNLLIAPASSFDTSSAGALYIGTSTATSIAIGKSGVTTTFGGAVTVAAGGATVSAGGIAVTGASSVNGNFTLGPATSHIISTQTTLPTESVVTYTAGTVAAGSTDAKGQFTVTTTAATGSVTLLFNAAYATAPVCVVSPASLNTSAATSTYVTTATNGLTVNYGVAPVANLQTWNYICAQ
jgi:fibronectin-binding autotransporter adhesin